MASNTFYATSTTNNSALLNGGETSWERAITGGDLDIGWFTFDPSGIRSTIPAVATISSITASIQIKMSRSNTTLYQTTAILHLHLGGTAISARTTSSKAGNSYQTKSVSNNVAVSSGDLHNANLICYYAINFKGSLKTTQYAKDIKCTINWSPINTTALSINKTSTTLNVGGSETLTVSRTPSSVSYPTISWSSSNTAVATVDGNGKVTAISDGVATITAKTTDGTNISKTCTVTVRTPATGILITPVSKEIKIGTTKPNLLDYSKWYSNSITATRAYISKNEYGLSLTSTENDSFTDTYHFNSNPVASEIATLDNFGFGVTAGKNYTFSVDVTQNSSAKSEMFVFWYDANKALLGYYWEGITGPGTISFTQQAPSGSAYSCIRLDNDYAGYTNLYTNIRVQEDTDTSAIGQCNVYAKVLPYNVTNEGYTLTSDCTDIATVSNNGLITAVSPGTCIITATSSDGGYKATCTITVISSNLCKIAKGNKYIKNVFLGINNVKRVYIGATQIFESD